MKEVLYDQWSQNRNIGGNYFLDSNNYAKVIESLEKLNGKEFSELLIKGDKNTLIIGGGNNKLYICTYVVGQHEDFYNLINEKNINGDKEIELVTGGQAGIFQSKMCCEFTNIVEAAIYFIKNENMNPSLIWELDQ